MFLHQYTLEKARKKIFLGLDKDILVYFSTISSKNQDFRVTIWLLGNDYMSSFRAFMGLHPPFLISC